MDLLVFFIDGDVCEAAWTLALVSWSDRHFSPFQKKFMISNAQSHHLFAHSHTFHVTHELLQQQILNTLLFVLTRDLMTQH